jgi:predicted nucleotide-binding protein (sugar kinase/HSP70/actin superfamily)
MTVGIPRSLFYYYDGEIWISFFKSLDINYVVSPVTTKEIIELGLKYSNDEMCMSLKNYIGHVAHLIGKCDYILVPRVDNYGTNNQTCTNFLAMYDLINNLFDVKLLNYNININDDETLRKGLIDIGYSLGKNSKLVKQSVNKAIKDYKHKRKRKIFNNILKLKSNKKKVLLISHSYNTYDEFIGKPIIKLLNDLDIEIIYSDLFNRQKANELSKNLSSDLYWKYSKDSIGSIELVKDRVDGILFLTTFPCGLDSLVNELVIRKINVPYLNIIIDDLDSLSGIETRVESFVDILNQ